MIRPNPSAIKTGDTTDLRRYAEEMEGEGIPVQGYSWIIACADKIDALSAEIAQLKTQSRLESPSGHENEGENDEEDSAKATAGETTRKTSREIFFTC